jgi:hypothetical protein
MVFAGRPSMKRDAIAIVLAALAVAVSVGWPQEAGQGQIQASAAVQPVSWDAWLQAKAKAEQNDAAGDYVTALQYYLEYIRQAEGLNNPVRVGWGKNNAAYMIIKMHREDPSVDLAPAGRLLREGLEIEGVPEDCRKIMAANLEYVRSITGSPR